MGGLGVLQFVALDEGACKTAILISRKARVAFGCWLLRSLAVSRTHPYSATIASRPTRLEKSATSLPDATVLMTSCLSK